MTTLATPSRVTRTRRTRPTSSATIGSSIHEARVEPPAVRLSGPHTAPGDVMARSDEELLIRYRDTRCPELLAELYRRYAAELGRFLRRYLGDATLADDAIQETFFQLIGKCGRYEAGRPARPWLYSVAVHRAIDVLRRRDRGLWVPGESRTADDPDLPADPQPGPLEALLRRERGDTIRAEARRLPPALSEVLMLAYDEDLSNAEIADRLGIPVGTVKSRLHWALTRLRSGVERTDLCDA